MIDYKKDGIDHINVYSQGATELGRMLSNFTREEIITIDGVFMSVECYWYWLGLECPEREQLRGMHGYAAKQLGEKLKKQYSTKIDNNFNTKILNAIWLKAINHKELFKEYKNLPFKHYYVFGDKVNDVSIKYKWMIDGFELIRKKILEMENFNKKEN